MISFKNFLKNISLNNFIIYTLFSIIIPIIYFNSEKIGVNSGFGWDGNVYASSVLNLFDKLINSEISSFYIIRIFPSLIIKLFILFFNIEPSTNNIVYSYLFINLIFIYASILIFIRITKHLKLSDNQQTLAFILIYINYFTLKQVPYYPTMTDGVAFFLGFSVVYSYLAHRQLLLAILTLFTGFTWPTGFYLSLILGVFPKNFNLRLNNNFYNLFKYISIILIIITSCYLFFIIIYYPNNNQQNNRIFFNYYFLSSALVLIYFYFILFYFFKFLPLSFNKRVFLFSLKNLVLILLVIITHALLIKHFSFPFTNNLAQKLTFVDLFKVYILQFFMQAATLPGISLISHFIFWGLSVPLIFIKFKNIFFLVAKEGFGLLVFLLVSLLYMIDSESRHHVFIIPVLIIFACKSISTSNISSKFLLLTFIIQLIDSKVWFNFGINWNIEASIYSFPQQFYFMNYGPWLSPKVYIVALFIFLICLASCFYSIYCKEIASFLERFRRT